MAHNEYFSRKDAKTQRKPQRRIWSFAFLASLREENFFCNLACEMTPKPQPEIRTITRLVPPSGNLVQGQSELAINPQLAQAAEELIKASRNHYSPAEGVGELREAVAKKIARFNNIQVDPKA